MGFDDGVFRRTRRWQRQRIENIWAMGEWLTEGRDIPGALHGSRFITLPHVLPEVERVCGFIQGSGHVLVEVGFDHGRRLHSTARRNPDWRVLGLEVRKRRVEEAMARAERDGVDNLLAWRMDARTVFAGVLPDQSVDVVEVLFPTPWWNPSLRRKRLLIDDAFLVDVARVLRPGGLFYVATDVPAYSDMIDGCLERSEGLVCVSEEEGMALRPACGQQSRREWRCEQDGLRWSRRFAISRVHA
jgi:tRNA (guanine-N(7)-)-methyltransferase